MRWGLVLILFLVAMWFHDRPRSRIIVVPVQTEPEMTFPHFQGDTGIPRRV